MSATGRSNVRRKDDFYATPNWCVDVLLNELRPNLRQCVCEPTAGNGAIVQRLLHHGLTDIQAIEIDPVRAKRLFELPISVRVGDARVLRPRRVPSLTVGNPPFYIAQEIIEACLGWTRGVVAMLLRLGFVGPECRVDFLRRHPCDIWVLDRRPSFVVNLRWEVGWYEPLGGSKRKFHRLGEPTFIKQEAQDRLAQMPVNGQQLTIRKTTVCNDSSEYAWFLWGLSGGGGHWRILQTRTLTHEQQDRNSSGPVDPDGPHALLRSVHGHSVAGRPGPQVGLDVALLDQLRS